MRDKHLLPVTMLLTAMCAAVWAAPKAASPQSSGQAQTRPAPTASKRAPQSAAEGERIFEQNCSRCHASPEGFPSRISGTIVRHMRVRASLSQHDAQELLRYLNQ